MDVAEVIIEKGEFGETTNGDGFWLKEKGQNGKLLFLSYNKKEEASRGKMKEHKHETLLCKLY